MPKTKSVLSWPRDYEKHECDFRVYPKREGATVCRYCGKELTYAKKKGD